MRTRDLGIVIGELDPASGDVVAALYEGLPGEVFRVPVPTAEAIKQRYVDLNQVSFHENLGVCFGRKPVSVQPTFLRMDTPPLRA